MRGLWGGQGLYGHSRLEVLQRDFFDRSAGSDTRSLLRLIVFVNGVSEELRVRPHAALVVCWPRLPDYIGVLGLMLPDTMWKPRSGKGSRAADSFQENQGRDI